MNTARASVTNVPEPVSGPPPAGGLVAGFHAATAPDGGLPGAIPTAAGSGGVLTTMWRFAALVSLLMVMLWMCSCTVATGNRNAGTYTYASFAGNAKFGEMGPEGMRNAEIDNATGAGLMRDTAKEAAKAYAWGKAFDALGNLIDDGFDALEDANDTDEAINASNNATKETIETFVPPEPELPAQ